MGYRGLTLVQYSSPLVSNSFFFLVRFVYNGILFACFPYLIKKYSLWNFISIFISVYERTRTRLILVVYLVTMLASLLCSENSKQMAINIQQWYKCHYALTSTSFLKLLICTPAQWKQSTGMFASTGIASLTFVIKLPHSSTTYCRQVVYHNLLKFMA